MKHAGQASIAATVKGTKPEESAPSCSGKMSRTGGQYGCSLELLPEEMVVNIFNRLTNKDLLACRAVCKRFVRVIGESVLLDKAKAFWQQFSQPPDPVLFSPDRYKQVLRPWFETLVTAQPRLADDASDDLQLSDSRREGTERQAPSEQTEQVEAIKSSQVKQLNRLIEHREFSKALFFIQSKTLQNAESLYFREKVSHFCSAQTVTTLCYSPDGRGLLIAYGYCCFRFMAFDENGNVIRQYDKDFNKFVEKLLFSSNGCSLLILCRDSTIIVDLDGEDWIRKGEIKHADRHGTACFSPDGGSLAAASAYTVSIMGRDEKGNWVLNSRIGGSARDVCFSPDGGSLAIAGNDHTVEIIARDGKGSWVLKSLISNSCGVLSVCFRPDGSLAILNSGSPSGLNHSVRIMVSDEEGRWMQKATIPGIDHAFSVSSSPDGRNLMVQATLHTFCLWSSRITGPDGVASRVWKHEAFHRNRGVKASFSPDGASLATCRDATTLVMGFDKGRWIERARIIPNTHCSRVEAVCFSPDSRRLAIILSGHHYQRWNAKIKIYEVKTGEKVLTDRDNQFLKGSFPS